MKHLHILRTLALSLLFIGSLLSAKAQITDYRNNLAIGFNAGATFNSVFFSPSIKQGTHQGLVGGFTARYISEKYFAMICGLQVECNFSQRGWKEKIEDGTGNTYQRTLTQPFHQRFRHVFVHKHRGREQIGRRERNPV